MKKHLVGGVSSAGRQLPEVNNKHFSCTKSQGAYIWDDDGNCYVDTILGFGSTILGHAPDAVLKSVTQQMQTCLLPGLAHPLEEQAAVSLTKNYEKLNKVVFVNSGSEAVHLACRIARGYTKKNKIIKLAGGYNGWFDDITNINHNYFLSTKPNDIDEFRNLVSSSEDIAAVILEPALANSGCLLLDENYLHELQFITKNKDIIIIADEILMGYRIHYGLTSKKLGIKPDIVTLGKAIGSGIPAASVISSEEIMTDVESGKIVRAGTYSGNPIACSAIISTLDQLAKQNYEKLLQSGNYLRSQLEYVAKSKDVALCTTGFGTVFTIWFSDTPPKSYEDILRLANQEASYKLHKEMRKRGVLIMPNNLGRIFLSFAHEEFIINEILNSFEFSFSQF